MQCINVIIKSKEVKVDCFCPIRNLLPSFLRIYANGQTEEDNKKETKSFRVDPRLWELVQAEAKSSNKRSTDVINEALARHLGSVLRGKMDLDNEKLVHFLTRLDKMTDELGEMRGDLSKYESKNRK